MQQWNIMEQCELMSRAQYAKALNNVTVRQRYNALCASIMTRTRSIDNNRFFMTFLHVKNVVRIVEKNGEVA